LFWKQSGTSESMAEDLRLAHRFMDLSENTRDLATARECYDKAHAAHAAVERVLKRKLPASAGDRSELAASVARLKSRLAAYENAHS
jgi:cell division septum initiation protein DivIVA